MLTRMNELEHRQNGKTVQHLSYIAEVGPKIGTFRWTNQNIEKTYVNSTTSQMRKDCELSIIYSHLIRNCSSLKPLNISLSILNIKKPLT